MEPLLSALVCTVTPFSAGATGVAQSTGLEEARTSSVEVETNFVPPCLRRRTCPKGLRIRGAVHRAAVPAMGFSALWAGRANTLEHLR